MHGLLLNIALEIEIRNPNQKLFPQEHRNNRRQKQINNNLVSTNYFVRTNITIMFKMTQGVCLEIIKKILIPQLKKRYIQKGKITYQNNFQFSLVACGTMTRKVMSP